MFEEFPTLKDAKRWAKANHRRLQVIVEADYYDDKQNILI